jgi:hypothetical protein
LLKEPLERCFWRVIVAFFLCAGALAANLLHTGMIQWHVKNLF